MSHKRLDIKIYHVSSGTVHAGVWMYGGVPDISQTTVPYINYGDNIFFDVRPICVLAGKLSSDIDGPSRMTAALLLETAGAMGLVRVAQLSCVSDRD